MFTDWVELDIDQKIIAMLHGGRWRAAQLQPTQEDDASNTMEEPKDKSKLPN